MANQAKRTSWTKPVPLTEALKGAPPPSPTVGRWTADVEGKTVARALFYPNEVHSVGGEPESMKSWLLLLAAVQEIDQGKHVFYVDMEANDRSIVDRLRRLGASKVQIRRLFHYFRPDEPMTQGDQNALRGSIKRQQPSLVVLDGVTEAYSLQGLSINAAEDAAAWFQMFSRKCQVKPTEDYAGPAIVELDHVVKDRDGRGNWTLGTQHKKAGIKGAMYIVESVSQFGKGKHGRSRLFLAKDSPGGVEWVGYGKDRRRYVGDLHCDAVDLGGDVNAWIESPNVEAVDDTPEVPLTQQPDFRLLMQKVHEYISKNAGCSLRSIRDNTVGSAERIASAVEALVSEGYVANQSTGQRGKYVVAKDFTALRVVPGGAKS
ncbi:AAA family ATPase [Nocardioides mangrovi]|uniref:AAA family ATPase n=1 Tax=Nocardioides mangrovi TaxID=2874580 RepID=A0ABS7UFJ8_9ACTN|nr:AAA family ATPase [Nocardioides mangrovi]MBZ5739771.1 AAA family ATPase [Nocardioides mangrovi]